MEPARVSFSFNSQLIYILARMALRVLEQGLDAPSSKDLSRVCPEPPETPETSSEAPKGCAR
jgi:hypothetical protein